ncbi:Fic family protein [Holdemanella biformis]|uniref:Fic family protein n=1 Tax=Holdemanella biformis TaxID=1735 RepID=UPI002657BAF5|nr:Fic family protein [Holdemanella biformis]
MRQFEYKESWKRLLTPNIVSLLTSIHEYKGEQNLFIESNSDKLVELLEIAKIQSTEASNKIEGIITTDDRLKKLVMDKTMPKSRSEKEIAGYRDVLNTIHESYEYIPINANYILQLHGDLYKYNGMSFGGKFKSTDNIIAEVDSSGNQKIRFQPIEAWATPEAMLNMCNAYNDALNNNIDPLILMPMFILDFLCIHPFNDGNGRMSRLLTLLLLYKSGYIVGKYISIEKLIEKSKDTYYEQLQASSYEWHDNKNDYEPFVEYYLGVVIAAYKEFSGRVQTLIESGMNKPERIREVIRKHIGKITKSQIMEKCPDISDTTVQRTLTELLKKNEIIKLSGGRYTSYIWNEEKE